MKGFSLYTFKRRSFKVSCNCRCEICCPVKVVNTKETFNLFGKRSASFRQPIRCPFNVSTPPIWFIITLSKYYSYYVPLKLVLLPGLDYLPYILQHLVVKSRYIVLRTMFSFDKMQKRKWISSGFLMKDICIILI